jgi:hypothetical protein
MLQPNMGQSSYTTQPNRGYPAANENEGIREAGMSIAKRQELDIAVPIALLRRHRTLSITPTAAAIAVR